ncbi:MAG TPA: NAD-glutamate dehydrogenase domain-containing protein, partial [Caulobacteraceae bacterium]
MTSEKPPVGVFSLTAVHPAFTAALGLSEADGADFLAKVLGDFRSGELIGLDEGDLASSLASFWRFAHDGDAASTRIRITPAKGADGRDLGLDTLEIAQPDAPFLVDSVMAEVSEAGAEVKAMFHPIVAMASGRVSMIQVWLEPLSSKRRATLVTRLHATLADVHAAVADAGAMRELLDATIADLEKATPKLGKAIGREAMAEDLAFLRWIAAGNLILLGARVYTYPRDADGAYSAEEPIYDAGTGLGLLRDPDRHVLRRSSEPSVLATSVRWRTEVAAPVLVAKANLRSRVHRRAHLDYIGVRRHGPSGEPVGETRFVGLFTAQAYEEPARDVPLLRGKIAQVMSEAGFAPGSHNAQRLAYILETFPRDELFQVTAQELRSTALDILHLMDRPRVKLFVRRDPYDRFVSILMYVPRDRYDERLGARAGALFAKAFGGHVSACVPSYSDEPLSRIHYIIGVPADGYVDADLALLEAEASRLARTWTDDFEAAIRQSISDGEEISSLTAAFAGAFPAGYRDRYSASEALLDALAIGRLGQGDTIAVRAYRTPIDSPLQFRFKLYRRGESPAALARVLPILGDMGLDALVEEGFPVRDAGRGPMPVWVHEFIVEDPAGEGLSFKERREPFEATFKAAWNGDIESDGFNRLVLELGVSWRQASLVRALARYRHQSGLDPRPSVQAQAVAAHPHVAKLLLDLFTVRLDPASGASLESRGRQAEALWGDIEEALRAVESLDHDRVLRRMAALVLAITRTNYYQPGAGGGPKPYISFKVASRELVDLPAPKPYREIFVASPRVEGVHLRLGPVARGGLRWSDRPDDYRTEVLGLVKAQQVKNAVIVPVGSKGGFYPKRLPRSGTPEAVRAEAIGAYRTFLEGLLDLTDTIAADGRVIHPADVVVHDG